MRLCQWRRLWQLRTRRASAQPPAAGFMPCCSIVRAVLFLMPAVGPVHIGQPFAVRNCNASLHLTWAALLWLNARLFWLRWFLFGFMLVTALATLEQVSTMYLTWLQLCHLRGRCNS